MPLPILVVGTTGIAATAAAYVVGRQWGCLKQFVGRGVMSRSTDTSMAAPKKDQDVTGEQPNEFEIKYREAKRYLAISCTALGIAVIGRVAFPPLAVASAGLSLYASRPMLRGTWQGLVRERRVKGVAVDSIFVLSGLAMGYYSIMALGDIIHYSSLVFRLSLEDRSRKTLDHMFGTQPRSVWLVVDGVEVETPVEQISRGQIVLIDAGQTVAIDGIVVAGKGIVDQHMLTGESQPAEKAPGDQIFAATVLTAGRIQVRVEKSGADTLVAGVEQIIRQTANYRSGVELRAQKLSNNLALPTLTVGALALVAMGPVSALAVLGYYFTDVVQMVAPLSTLTFLSQASRRSMLVKDGRSLELLGDVDTIVFDKTGTLTEEQPSLHLIHCVADLTEQEILSLAAAAEYRQTHPIARAILAAAEEADISIPAVEPASYRIGHGIQVDCEGRALTIGSRRFIEELGFSIPGKLDATAAECDQRGYLLVYLAVDDTLVAALELHTTLRPEAVEVVRYFKDLGLDICVLSGDREGPTRELATRLGITHWFANTLPQDKARHIRALRAREHKVCFVGDGINDTIAMKESLVSVSIHGATTAATDTAGIVLMNNDLRQLMELMALSQDYQSNLKRGFTLVLAPGIIGLGGVFLLGLGVSSTVFLYGTAIAGGAANALIPRLKSGHEDDQEPQELDG